MENCKANNIPEKRTEVAGNRVSDYYARNIYKGLSKNSCSVDLIDIKITLPKH